MQLKELSPSALEELATKLRHAIARNPEESHSERIELENVNQWIALRQQQTEGERHDP
jgi:hypothetical protein